MNTLEIIINALTKQGYTEDEAGNLIAKLIEEQKQLDELRDLFVKLVNWLTNVEATASIFHVTVSYPKLKHLGFLLHRLIPYIDI